MLKDFGWTSTEAEDGRLLLLAVSFGAATVEKLRTLNLRAHRFTLLEDKY